MEEVKKIYSGYGEYERLIRHRMEFYINLRYIKENIPDKSLKILYLGGGPGRYAIELTKAGHKVTLIDLTDFHVKEAKRLSKEEKIKLHIDLVAAKMFTVH
ncbi:MAG TPA: hypothetical protein PLK90_09760 [Clostridiales bacterium]|nr:hypothetical protein [Clostridiales bacterium]HQP70671.1 hypothetical protein [Clostridiales bacterium]